MVTSGNQEVASNLVSRVKIKARVDDEIHPFKVYQSSFSVSKSLIQRTFETGGRDIGWKQEES